MHTHLTVTAVHLLSNYGVYKNPSCVDAHLLSYHCDFHPRYSYISLPIQHIHSDIYLPFRKLIWILRNSLHQSSATCAIYYCLHWETYRSTVPIMSISISLSPLFDTFRQQGRHRGAHESVVWFRHLHQCHAVSGTNYDSGAADFAASFSADSGFICVLTDRCGRHLGQCFSGPIVAGYWCPERRYRHICRLF